MNLIRHANQALLRLGVGAMLTPLLLAGSLFGKNIRVTLTPSNSQAAKGEQITVAVHVDVTDVDEALGSYTARLRWNPQALKLVRYAGGATEGFSNPVINQKEAEQGRLTFAQAYPMGAKGRVSILNLTFEVIGAEVRDNDLNVEFSAMASAYTFENLVPKLESVVTGVKDQITVAELPKSYALLPNLPNPFRDYTEIRYALPMENHAILTVFNLLGQKVKTLVSGTVAAGANAVRWDGTDDSGRLVPAGIYIYRLEANGFVDEKKMVVIR